MRCTVNKLAKISGVSVRTLHWYDHIGLLKPAFYEANGYRYYEEEQLLKLQQILFFRELGFPLKDIQKMLNSNYFDKISALQAHKQILESNVDRMHKLTDTIDKTILHLRGMKDMTDKEIYSGFEKNQKNEYEQYIFKYSGTIAEDLIGASVKNEELSEPDKEALTLEGNKIYKGIAECIDQNMTHRIPEVQSLIKKHYQLFTRNHNMTKDVYLAYAQLYCESSDFRKILNRTHPKLADFIAEAMRYYAKMNLQ